MGLKERLMQDLKEAMKSGDDLKRNTVRILRGAVRNVEIDVGHDLSEEDVLAVIAKQAKQRRDSIEQFQQANRLDLVELEQQELTIIETYLPQPMTDEEITQAAQAVIAETGVTDMKGMGPVMGRLSKELKGRADGKRISQIVRSLLTG